MHYAGSAVRLVFFFRCNSTALEGHVTGSAVGLGFCCSWTALTIKGVRQIRAFFFYFTNELIVAATSRSFY